MGSILFRPICSNCRKEIKDFIDAYAAWESVDLIRHYVIPMRCPNCDEYFSTVEVPTKLPFDNTDKEKKMMAPCNVIDHPRHYADTCSIECIEAMEIAFGEQVIVDFCICNAFKYLWRHKNKNGLEDLDKASWYLTRAESVITSSKDSYSFEEDKISSMRLYLAKYYSKYAKGEKDGPMQ